jgi:phosphatidylinositol alpha 1,6-mannosyltransferase
MCVCTYIGELPGILSGEALGEAFANMDAFVFPSRTDTFGLVVMEAMASGVPVVVSPETGERVGIRHGVTGFHAPDLHSFTGSVLQLMNNESLRQRIGAAARAFTGSRSWNGVFEQLYRTYEWGLEGTGCKRSDPAIAESQTTS